MADIAGNSGRWKSIGKAFSMAWTSITIGQYEDPSCTPANHSLQAMQETVSTGLIGSSAPPSPSLCFTKQNSSGCTGRNELGYQSATRAECAALCAADCYCVSWEFKASSPVEDLARQPFTCSQPPRLCFRAAQGLLQL